MSDIASLRELGQSTGSQGRVKIASIIQFFGTGR